MRTIEQVEDSGQLQRKSGKERRNRNKPVSGDKTGGGGGGLQSPLHDLYDKS